MSSAGSVKIAPAASPSPDAAAVCTMLFSRMLDWRKRRRTAIEMTAPGVEADTVIPAQRPREAVGPAGRRDSTTPRTRALIVISGSVTDAGMYGASVWPGVVE